MNNKLSLKKIFTGVVIYFITIQMGVAQANTIGITGKWGTQIFLSDVNGRAFENKYADITGSPYFLPDYKYSTIIMSDGKQFENVKAKINLVEHEVVFIDSKGQEGYIGKGLVSIIYFYDTTNAGIKSYMFRTGLPRVDNQTNLSFYQVLNPNGGQLVKSISKTIEDRGNELSGEKYKEFVTRENLYFFENGVIQRAKKDKAFFATLFVGKLDEYNKIITVNKINFKDEYQLVTLMNYFNQIYHPVY
jgi:hypothetical protein